MPVRQPFSVTVRLNLFPCACRRNVIPLTSGCSQESHLLHMPGFHTVKCCHLVPATASTYAYGKISSCAWIILLRRFTWVTTVDHPNAHRPTGNHTAPSLRAVRLMLPVPAIASLRDETRQKPHAQSMPRNVLTALQITGVAVKQHSPAKGAKYKRRKTRFALASLRPRLTTTIRLLSRVPKPNGLPYELRFASLGRIDRINGAVTTLSTSTVTPFFSNL